MARHPVTLTTTRGHQWLARQPQRPWAQDSRTVGDDAAVAEAARIAEETAEAQAAAKAAEEAAEAEAIAVAKAAEHAAQAAMRLQKLRKLPLWQLRKGL